MRSVFHLPPLPRTLRACQSDLKHSDEKVRLDVVRDLGRSALPDERSGRVDLLRSCLRDDSPTLRRQALLSLADLEAREAVEDVERLLGDPEIPVRQMAVLALGELADPADDRVIGRLHALLSAGAPAIRYQALSAVAQLRPQEALGDLRRALTDSDREIRALALRLVDEALIAQGVALDSVFLEELARAARDPDPEVRLLAQLVSHESNQPTASDAIEGAVLRRVRPSEPRDEQRAIEWAGRLRLERLTPCLRRRAFGLLGWSHDPFRFSALSVLSRWGDERAFRKLLALLRGRRGADRGWAVEALSKSCRQEALDALSAHRRTADASEHEQLDQALASLTTDLRGLER